MITNSYSPNVVRSKLEAESVFLYRPAREWMFSHHPHITFFQDRLVAAWSNGRQDEDAPGQRVLVSTATDFSSWTEPRPLFPSLPGKGGGETILTAAGFHAYPGTLVAYAARYEPDRSGTRLLARTSTDGENWGEITDLGLPICPNHGPQRTASGRLIIAGNFAFPYTDDPAGLSGWRMTGPYPPDLGDISDNPWSFWHVARALGRPALCEGSVYQTDDGVLHAPLRVTGEDFRGRLWVTESRDDGAAWTEPVETEFSDNDTKFHFGRLPDGRFYYVGCPDPAPRGRRSPLVLSLSSDGVVFGTHYILGDTHYEMQKDGLYKGGEYGYPHTLVHDGFLYTIVSRQKEGIEVIRAALASL